ncbi:MerR family transcriptional regulator [Sporolactobacillus sp. THM7-7]|nr:MerR family transcriptional regulator [Sporolactobacillus sp. THM7-7]
MALKSFYKIKEVSKLFNIGIDSLRYYEKVGILSPKRGNNGYRYYSLQDLQKIQTLNELHSSLDVPLTTIRDYLTNRKLKSTLGLLERQSQEITQKIAHLKKIRSKFQRTLRKIYEAAKENGDETIQVVRFPKRNAICLHNDFSGEELEANYFLQELIQLNKIETALIGNPDCYELEIDHSSQNSPYFNCKTIFFTLSPEQNVTPNYFLPAGEYLTLSYRGDYINTKRLFPKLRHFAENHHYRICSNLFEICKLGCYETDDTGEYLTELQVQVKRK